MTSAASLTALALGVGDQPLKGDVDVVLLFARDTIAADFPVLYAGEVPVEDKAEVKFHLVSIDNEVNLHYA